MSEHSTSFGSNVKDHSIINPTTAVCRGGGGEREFVTKSTGGIVRTSKWQPNTLLSILQSSSSTSALASLPNSKYAHKPTSSLSPSSASTIVKGIWSSRLKQTSSDLIGQHKSFSSSLRSALPTAPERVLDAPGIADDFYLNVMDWSRRGMLAIGLESAVYVWNGADGSVKELLHLLPTNATDTSNPYISSISWMRDGKTVGVGTSEGCIQIWDVEYGKKLRTMIASLDSRISSLSWNRHLISGGSRGGSLCSHDVRIAAHRAIEHELSEPAEVCGLAWSPDGQQLASGTNDNLVHVYDCSAGLGAAGAGSTPSHVFEGHSSAVKALAWCPWKPQTLASGGGSQDKTIRIWSTATNNAASLSTLRTPPILSHTTNSQISALVWSTRKDSGGRVGGGSLASAHGYDNNEIALWDLSADCTQIESLGSINHAHDSRILAMKPCGVGAVVSVAADESIKFWNVFPQRCSGPDDEDAGAGRRGNKKKVHERRRAKNIHRKTDASSNSQKRTFSQEFCQEEAFEGEELAVDSPFSYKSKSFR